ncbi:MAG: SCO family protein [Roseobacter sp.]
MRLIAILSTVAIVGLLGGLWLATSQTGSDDQFASCRGSSIAGGPETIGGPFELVNGDGETVTEAEVIKEPSLLYFGYTFCPDVCPFDVARNADATDVLEQRGVTVTPVFISVDPQRDTPEIVGDFAEALHDRMIGLTGTPEQVSAASQAYRTYYKAHDDGDEFYLVDHSTFTYLVLPEHGFVEFFRREVSADEMADRVSCFVDNA